MNQPAASSVRSGAHWTIYLPSLAVAGTWGLVYFWAVTRDPALSAIAAIALAIEVAVVPLLLIHAFLRARVLEAEVGAGKLRLVSGFPVRRRLDMELGEIAVAQVRRPVAQRLFGGGALALITRQGKRHLVADLADADAIAAAINNAIRRNGAA
ncbi:PH domain-containing protein [Parvibaculum sp.]|uniref:PH domain-containing protein n=1 Tax=Parvibaculum sp. TaxID=2024848 RepID=UPI00391D9024